MFTPAAPSRKGAESRPPQRLTGFRGGVSAPDASSSPLQASQALCTLLPVTSYKKAVAELFPQLLMALTLQHFYGSHMSMVADKGLL